MLPLIWPEWKREKESQTIRHQKFTSSICFEQLLNPQYEFRNQTEGMKNLSQQKGFITRFLNSWYIFKQARSFPRNKSKIKRKLMRYPEVAIIEG